MVDLSWIQTKLMNLIYARNMERCISRQSNDDQFLKEILRMIIHKDKTKRIAKKERTENMFHNL